MRLPVHPLISVVLFVFFAACQNGDTPDNTQEKKTDTAFTSAAGALGRKQLRTWQEINPALNSLARTYAEKISNADDSAAPEATGEYLRKRDSICTVMGLTGGYTEYVKISEDLNKPVNQPLLDSLNLSPGE
ncbi:MAG: hypothetical protein ACQEQV_06315 [Fibrobacterota bacterium]